MSDNAIRIADRMGEVLIAALFENHKLGRVNPLSLSLFFYRAFSGRVLSKCTLSARGGRG